jgi:hypothetical protein
MAYDIADQHATAIIWTLPRTSYQTATALRHAGWDIRDNLVHLFGTGWAKTGNALAPGQEGWLLATKGKPDLDIDACRVPRGGDKLVRPAVQRINGVTAGNGMGAGRQDEPGGSLPKNAILSHCEECAKEEKRCLAGCICGARSKWDPENPLPRCPCGETWRWICPVAEVNAQSGDRLGMTGGGKHRDGYQGGMFGKIDCESTLYGGKGGAARFFSTFSYLSKCSSSERHAGCDNLYWKANKKNPFGFDQVTREEWEADAVPVRKQPNIPKENVIAQGNVHPTVKSYRLMHWLHSLTGAKKIVDLSAGSGTGMITAALDGIEWIGAEMCREAVTIAQARHAFWAGLSHEARRAMAEESIVPSRFEPDERQRSLF